MLAGIGLALTLTTARVLPDTLPPSARHDGGLAHSVSVFGELLHDRSFVGVIVVHAVCFGAVFAYISGLWSRTSSTRPRRHSARCSRRTPPGWSS